MKYNNKMTHCVCRTTSTILKHYHNHFSDMLLLPFGCMSFLSYSISQYSHHCEFCELILPFQKFQNGSTRSCRKTIRKTTRKSTSLAREKLHDLMKQSTEQKWGKFAGRRPWRALERLQLALVAGYFYTFPIILFHRILICFSNDYGNQVVLIYFNIYFSTIISNFLLQLFCDNYFF
jgi:hypothetical protein